uniref:TIR domain-containing protein n=1 Tax=Chelydra serpentina TaxID=8475 RepID=A0A8C3SL01_CHESE
ITAFLPTYPLCTCLSVLCRAGQQSTCLGQHFSWGGNPARLGRHFSRGGNLERSGVREMLFLQLFSALIFFSQGQGVAPYSLENCMVHGKWSKMIKVLCYHQNLVRVPSHLPWNVSSLDLSENQIASLRQSDFRKLSLLQVLNVSQNQIHLIEEGTFTHTSSLKTLNLTSNQLRVLSSSMFDGLGNLTVLLLRENNIDRIEPSAFAHLMKLKVIDLSSNKENNITNFMTKDIVNVPMWLRELDASHNPISFIDVATDALYRLLSLDLSFSGTHNHITWIIRDPCFLKGLKRLYLGGIFMTPLDILVCLWHRNVKTLNLQGNKFKSIKGIVFENCTHLWHLDLTHNKLKVILCISFQPLKSLQSLLLANNEFTTVPNATSNIMSLKSLDLSFNQIRKIVPNDFANLKNLKHLTLTGNRITKISSDLFPDLHNLLELNLGMNLLLEISQPFSDSLGKLEKMELSGNKMSSIKKETFRNLTSLQLLSLLDNQISTIEPGAFEGLSHLQTLLLAANKITKETFQKGIFQGVNSLVDLQLFENYISYETSGELDNPPFILLKSLKYLSLNSNLAITDLDPATFSYTTMLKELDLSNNPINAISPALFQPVPKLTELHLNKIGLQSLDFVLHVNFSKLVILRVSGNKLNVIELKHIRALPYLTFLDLRQNPFTCSCDNQMFLKWSLRDLKTQVIYFYQYTCAFPLASKGRKLWAFHTASCTVDHEFILFVTNTATIILLMIVCICFRWRWQGIYAYHLLLAYIHDKRYKRMRQHKKYDYDAFVSYNTHDREWVIHELLPTLEDKYHWRLCLHHHDFEPGKCILKNIVENIYASRKTICVITRHYLESEWCSKEIQVASFRLFDEHKDVLVLIFLEHIPSENLSPYHRMRKLVKKKTYLIWPQEEEEIPLFWHKLNMALKTKKVRCKLSFSDSLK